MGLKPYGNGCQTAELSVDLINRQDESGIIFQTRLFLFLIAWIEDIIENTKKPIHFSNHIVNIISTTQQCKCICNI